jgi:hypothetical protein
LGPGVCWMWTSGAGTEVVMATSEIRPIAIGEVTAD